MRNFKEIQVLDCPSCDDVEMTRTPRGDHTCGACGWTESR